MITDIIQFINVGVAGVILLWFMFRLERILVRFDRTVNLMARAMLRLLEQRDHDTATALSKELHRVSSDGDDD